MKEKERMMEMLSSKDIEMVKLGAIILTNTPRKEWTPTLRSIKQNDWYFTINNNRLEIHENTYKVSSWASVSFSTGYSSYSNGNITVSTIVEDYNEKSRDFDEERLEEFRKNQRLASIRNKNQIKIYEKRSKNYTNSRTGANALKRGRS